jgi:hypothetical protein
VLAKHFDIMVIALFLVRSTVRPLVVVISVAGQQLAEFLHSSLGLGIQLACVILQLRNGIGQVCEVELGAKIEFGGDVLNPFRVSGS